jgi:hypothetical protein
MRRRPQPPAPWWARVLVVSLLTAGYGGFFVCSSEVITADSAVIYERDARPFVIDTVNVHPLEHSMMPIIEPPEARGVYGTLARLSALDKPERGCVLRPSLCGWYLPIVEKICRLETESRSLQAAILTCLPPDQALLEPIDKTLVDCSGLAGVKQLSLVDYYLVNMAQGNAPPKATSEKQSKVPKEPVPANDFEGVLNLLVVATRSTSKPLPPEVLAALIPKVEKLRDTHLAMAGLCQQIVESLGPYRRTFLPPNALEQACSRDAEAVLQKLRGQVQAKSQSPQQPALPRFAE